MTAPWTVRYVGTPTTVPCKSAQAVVDGLKEGEWDASDEVRGPGDMAFRVIEVHPQFTDICAELAHPAKPHDDETHLDMNPLIDVSLVLLIFFILTTSYASLRRTIDIPADPEEGKQSQAPPKEEDIKDRTFNVDVWMEAGKPLVQVGESVVPVKDVEKAIKEMVKVTQKREMILAVDGRVPWGAEAAVHDAAKGAGVQNIFKKKWNPKG
jgi:biopolymer transport protein ExbD